MPSPFGFPAGRHTPSVIYLHLRIICASGRRPGDIPRPFPVRILIKPQTHPGSCHHFLRPTSSVRLATAALCGGFARIRGRFTAVHGGSPPLICEWVVLRHPYTQVCSSSSTTSTTTHTHHTGQTGGTIVGSEPRAAESTTAHSTLLEDSWPPL